MFGLCYIEHMEEISLAESSERWKIRQFMASSQSIITYIQLVHFASHKLHHLSTGVSNQMQKGHNREKTTTDQYNNHFGLLAVVMMQERKFR